MQDLLFTNDQLVYSGKLMNPPEGEKLYMLDSSPCPNCPSRAFHGNFESHFQLMHTCDPTELLANPWKHKHYQTPWDAPTGRRSWPEEVCCVCVYAVAPLLKPLILRAALTDLLQDHLHREVLDHQATGPRPQEAARIFRGEATTTMKHY